MSLKLHISARIGVLFALCCVSGFAEDRYVVKARGDINQIAKRYGLNVVKSLTGSAVGHHVLSSSGKNPQQVLRSLASEFSVQTAEPEKPVALPGIAAAAAVHPPNAPKGAPLPLDGTQIRYYRSLAANAYVNQAAASVIKIQQAHNLATGTARVAIIDTGIDRSNLVLAGSVGEGWDFVHNSPLGQEQADINQETTPILDQETTPILDQETTPILDGGTAVVLNQETTPILDQETTPILDSRKYPAYGHGTMVSGLIHLVAPNATLLPVRTFAANGKATISQIVAGIYWAIDHHADVINMSFSTSQDSDALSNAIAAAIDKGIVCIASAGNDGRALSVYPAAYSNVIGVGSTNNSNLRSLFSNFGSNASLAAPGEALITTYPSSAGGARQHYAEVWGTSFSAPLVTGAAALLVDLNNRMTGSLAGSIFALTSVSLGDQGLGAGELDVFQAATYASKRH